MGYLAVVCTVVFLSLQQSRMTISRRRPLRPTPIAHPTRPPLRPSLPRAPRFFWFCPGVFVDGVRPPDEPENADAGVDIPSVGGAAGRQVKMAPVAVFPAGRREGGLLVIFMASLTVSLRQLLICFCVSFHVI